MSIVWFLLPTISDHFHGFEVMQLLNFYGRIW